MPIEAAGYLVSVSLYTTQVKKGMAGIKLVLSERVSVSLSHTLSLCVCVRVGGWVGGWVSV